MALKLLQTHTITFTRHGSDSDKPYINEYGESVAPSGTSEIVTQGSLQPFSKKNNRLSLPEGTREEDFWVYYTDALLTPELRTTEQFDNNLPDTCTIDGKIYKVLRKGDWSGYKLTVDNYEYYLQLVQPKGS